MQSFRQSLDSKESNKTSEWITYGQRYVYRLALVQMAPLPVKKKVGDKANGSRSIIQLIKKIKEMEACFFNIWKPEKYL